jgi:hypothetical protein
MNEKKEKKSINLKKEVKATGIIISYLIVFNIGFFLAIIVAATEGILCLP